MSQHCSTRRTGQVFFLKKKPLHFSFRLKKKIWTYVFRDSYGLSSLDLPTVKCVTCRDSEGYTLRSAWLLKIVPLPCRGTACSFKGTLFARKTHEEECERIESFCMIGCQQWHGGLSHLAQHLFTCLAIVDQVIVRK